MGHDPNLEALRKQAAGRPQIIDRLAIAAGLALMSAIIYIIYDEWTDSRSMGEVLIAIGMVIASFIIGSVAVYALYHGSKTILHITQKYWWVFVLLIIGLVAYLQLKQ